MPRTLVLAATRGSAEPNANHRDDWLTFESASEEIGYDRVEM
jgi:hypothetical protein